MYIVIGTNLFVMFYQVEIFRIIAAPTSSCCTLGIVGKPSMSRDASRWFKCMM
jgi:hypothetical protein